jgi:hypothetical protein
MCDCKKCDPLGWEMRRQEYMLLAHERALLRESHHQFSDPDSQLGHGDNACDQDEGA